MAGAVHGTHLTAYRRVLRLYPRDLRAEYGEEMIQVFAELVRERGRRAWSRTVVDLAVSVPRTHLEAIMSTTSTRTALVITLTVAGAVAVIGVLAFGPIALPAAIIVLGLAFAQRSRLARAVDGPTPSPSRAAVIGLVASSVLFAGAIVSWLVAIDRGYGFPDGVLFAFNAIGFLSLAGVIASTAVLVARRRRAHPGG